MQETQFILKERLKEIISDKQVRAALFYTFNFDPKFFENYVMPLLVPDQVFINNNIANNIIWRRLYKDHKVPPITVYFDQDAKSIENGPMLAYILVPISMPNVGKNKGNFHPKLSFILTVDSNDEEDLIVISGSNNITQGGWCENIECISQQILSNGKFFPYEFKSDLKDFIAFVNENHNKQPLTEAEEIISGFFKKIKYTRQKDLVFYNSFQCSFTEFLNQFIFQDTTIHSVEIITPYFKPGIELVNYFKNKGLKVKIQAPFKNGYCLMEKEVYNNYRKNGVKWYYQIDDTRYSHAKLYRFFGEEKVYTIIGSVNLTQPAWVGVPDKIKEIYNIESAVLFIEQDNGNFSLLAKEIKDDAISFIDPEPSTENWFERVEIPDLLFTIDWSLKIISWKGKTKNLCVLNLPPGNNIDLNEFKQIEIETLRNSKEILEALARHPLLKVTETNNNNTEITHYFYPNQIGFEQRPLEFRFSASDIIDVWELLGEEDQQLNEWLISRVEQIADLIQDESGRIINETSEEKSLLNEMARHFYGLVKLEGFLFNEAVWGYNNAKKLAHYNNLIYYLTYDNVDTLVSYLKDIEKAYADGAILPAYYWLLLQVIKTNFYNNELLMPMLKELNIHGLNENRPLKKQIGETISELEKKNKKIASSMDLNIKKLNWANKIINNKYEFS